MVELRSFRAYIPSPDKAKEVAALPYDVMSIQEGKDITINNPLSFLHVEKSSIDFPIGVDEHSDAVHKKAKENLTKLISQNILEKSAKPCFYIYQQIMGKYKQIGIVAATSVSEYDRNIIKKHELTREDKEMDRTHHVDITNANTGAVFLTYKHKTSLDSIITKLITEKPHIDFTSDDNIKHTLWVISNDHDIKTITDEFKTIPCLYIADGHHRTAAASNVCKQRKDKNKNHNGSESYNYFLSVIFPDNQVNVMDYNRAVKTMNGYTRASLLEKLKEKFEVSPVIVSNPEEAKPKIRACFTMYIEGVWYYLRTKPAFIPQNSPVKSLDVSILQNEILEPLFGITNPRTDKNLDFIGGIRGMRELVKRCQEDCKIGFALLPTGVDQLMQIADAGDIMPPKSTWFEPKLRSGLIVNLLED
jgi:uncharacterized protein (DUF1015 family)